MVEGMATHYELNYDWSKLGPTPWTETSLVKLQADFHSYDDGDQLWLTISRWWEAMEKDDTGVAFDGGCFFPAPVRVSTEHVTAWICSHGEDAFDSIAHYAEELRAVAESADPEVTATWTELPHTVDQAER